MRRHHYRRSLASLRAPLSLQATDLPSWRGGISRRTSQAARGREVELSARLGLCLLVCGLSPVLHLPSLCEVRQGDTSALSYWPPSWPSPQHLSFGGTKVPSAPCCCWETEAENKTEAALTLCQELCGGTETQPCVSGSQVICPSCRFS